jgi:hypothetical protein
MTLREGAVPGRPPGDSLIVSLQNTLIYPEFARGALEILGSRQAKKVDNYRDAEPGKILHEMLVERCALASKFAQLRTGSDPIYPTASCPIKKAAGRHVSLPGIGPRQFASDNNYRVRVWSGGMSPRGPIACAIKAKRDVCKSVLQCNALGQGTQHGYVSLSDEYLCSESQRCICII